MRTSRDDVTIADLADRLRELEHAAELIKTVLIVKEPQTLHAASAFDGLRKQVLASTSERRTHLTQLTAMAVAVRRATTVDDLRPQVREWLQQAGVVEIVNLPHGVPADQFFEDVDGASLAGATALDVVEPAYVDQSSNSVLRLGRARQAIPAGELPDPRRTDPLNPELGKDAASA